MLIRNIALGSKFNGANLKGILLVITIYLCFSASYTYGQEPVKLNVQYTGDLLNNYRGGIRSGTNYLGMANLTISFSSQDAELWNGGHFFLNAANTHGATPTANLTGDFQGISNIEAGNLSYLHELWFKQEFSSFYVIAGLQDLSAEFAISEYGSHYINSSFGVHSTLADNIPSPLFPLTALGVLLNAEISDEVSIKTAAFDGLPDDFDSNPHNLKWDINSRDGILTVSEINFTSEIDSYSGTYKLGTYYHNHIATNDEESGLNDNYGFYFVGDQVLYQNLAGKQIGVFAQLGISPVSRNENHFYLGTGLNYTGFLNRPDDIIGLAIAHAGLSHRANETVIELSYRARINNYLSLQPDLQYVINPSGTETNLRNTLAGILRIGIEL